MTKYILVPDIQGDLNFLLSILATYQADAQIKFIFLGDVFGGLQGNFRVQLDVLEIVVKLMLSNRAIVCEGNHDIWSTQQFETKTETLRKAIFLNRYSDAYDIISNLKNTEYTFKKAFLEELIYAQQNVNKMDERFAKDRFLKALSDVDNYISSPNRVHVAQVGNFLLSHANWRPYARKSLKTLNGWETLKAGRINPLTRDDDIYHLDVITGNLPTFAQTQTTSRKQAGLKEDEFWVSGHWFEENNANNEPKLVNDFHYMMDNGHGKNLEAKNIVGLLTQENGNWRFSYEDLDAKEGAKAA